MSHVAVTGWSALCAAGVGQDALVGALNGQGNGHGAAPAGVDELDGEALPGPPGLALRDFDVREHLGRKGTSFLDRVTALAMVGCGLALEDGRVDVSRGDRIGIVLGMTAGGLKSTCDYSRETLVQDKPYLVNPVLFPNSVMNCSAGQAAIRFGLRGVNTTIAGGQLAFLQALRYGGTSLLQRRVDALLAGALEELTPHTAWTNHLLNGTPELASGEGGAVFVLERADDARAAGRRIDADVLAVSTGFAARIDDQRGALAEHVRRALDEAGIGAGEVARVATGDADETGLETAAVADALGPGGPEHIRVKRVLGECQGGSGSLQLAAVLARHRDDPSTDGAVSLLTGHTRDGGVGAAVIRGWSRVGAAHR